MKDIKKESLAPKSKAKGKEVQKEEPDDISTVIVDGDREDGLGDDSNAPNPKVEAEDVKDEKTTPGKRKRVKEESDIKDEDDEESEVKDKRKRAGHQIEVVRKKDADEGSKTVSCEQT